MHIKIKKISFSSFKEDDLLLSIPDFIKIEDLQKLICTKFKIDIHKQKLYYGGKELFTDHYISEYNIKNNDVIQLLEKSPDCESDMGLVKTLEKTNTLIETKSNYYEVGDCIDVIYKSLGAWFEAKIINILSSSEKPAEEDLIFKIVMDRHEKNAPIHVTFNDIRPRSYYEYKNKELQPGMIVLVNYNIAQPSERGYWYDLQITRVSRNTLKGILLMGPLHNDIVECVIKFKKKVMRIETATLLIERTENMTKGNIPLRDLPLYCDTCKDVSSENCKECSCNVCGKKDAIESLILCEECDYAYHTFCINPPLLTIPEEDWYCSDCKTDENEIIKPGEKLKVVSTKQSNLSKRSFASYFGFVPGVEVGTSWQTEKQVIDAGVHGKSWCGVYGNNRTGVYSIMLKNINRSRVIDNGDEFYYMERTGRYVSKQRRICVRNINQHFSKIIGALISNCNLKSKKSFPFGIAQDWKNGKPIRIIRSSKLFSKFAPKCGLRYDGIYKVVEYFPDIGRRDEVMLKFLLRRDDLNPAPWHFYSTRPDLDSTINKELASLINSDLKNNQLWSECKATISKGKELFSQKVEELFVCICCHDLPFKPVTLQCCHNICLECLKNCFAADIYNCPQCRSEMNGNNVNTVNTVLEKALKLVVPRYVYMQFNR